MTFPVYLHVSGYTLHPHPVMEGLAYAVGMVLQLHQRRRALNTAEAAGKNMWIAVGALVGALLGAKMLAILESPAAYGQLVTTHGWAAFLEGKTIVGGLLGGWLGVEITKKIVHEKASTGDAWVLPLTISIAIGRVGCFLTGLSDQTHGIASSLPWAVDFGDGIRRHPTQLYEIAFLLVQLVPLLWLKARPHPSGLVFRLFVLGYCTFRLAVEFIKPVERHVVGLNAIQWTCIAAILYCLYNLRILLSQKKEVTHAGPAVSVL